MLVFSSTDGKPLIYTGSNWETLCTNNIVSTTPQDYFCVKNGIPYLPSLSSIPPNPLSGSVYYSIIDKSLMIYNGTSWVKMTDLLLGSIADHSGFTSGSAVKTYKLPVLNSNPSPTGLTAGAIYVNSISKTIRYFDGSNWNDLTCGPVVITSPVVNNTTGRTASSGGNVLSNGISNITLTGICWGTYNNPDTTLSTKTKQATTGTGVGPFVSNMTSLAPNTTYYVRAYALNNEGITYGNDVTFTTPIALPLIITLPADSITPMRAVSGGNISDDGGSSVTKRGIIWSVLGDPLSDPSYISTVNGSGTGKYFGILTNLFGSTTYYVRAYATNGIGTAHGNLISFTTPPPVPATITSTVNVTNITGTGATASATVLSNGGAVVTEKGVCITTDHITYQYLPSSTVNPLNIGPFVVNLSGLTEGTTYYIKAYAINSVDTAYSNESQFTTAKLVNITTTPPANLIGNIATSGGIINDVGYSVITARGICWDTLANPTNSLVTKTADSFSGNGTGSYTSTMTGLIAGKTYYVRAYAINAAGVSYGQQEQITLPDSAKVITLAASSLFGTTATVGGNVVSDGGASVTDRGVCWSINPNPTTNNAHTTDGDGLGMFTSVLNGLSQNVVYHYRAYAKNIIGISYGQDRTFTIVPGAPVIITLPIQDITSISALSGGNITSNGGAPITKRGILWSSNGDPVYDPDAVITNDGSGVGEFPSNLMRLLGSTTYYVRAYAINAYGTSYGDLLQFTTPPPVLASINPATISQVTDSSATGTFLILNNGGAPITSRGLCYSTDHINYTFVTSATSNGSDIGTFTVHLTGLAQNQTYYVKPYATNGVGTAYGSETSFKTSALPSLTTTTPQGIGAYDAYSGGTVLYVGDEKLQARGICWSKDTIPTFNLPTKTSDAVGGNGIGTFTSRLTGLTPSTKYYVRAYAINSVGISYGNLDSLVTNSPPTLATTRPSAMTSTSVVVGGTISADGGCDVTSRGVCWATTPYPTTLNNYTASGSGTGTFVTTLSNLMGSTKYYVRAYAINCTGITYGQMDSLITASPILPVVSTTDVINIGSNSATGRGNATNAGGGTISERGICWNETGNPTINDNHAVAGGTGLGSFSATITGLAPVKKYYMRAYVINEIGITYGDVIPFTTFTTATISTSAINTITNISASGGGQIISDGGTPVTSSGICWSTSPNPTIGDTHTTSGTGIGNFIHDITGLMGSTTYYVRAYATNAAGTTYGQQETFTTEPPVLATITTNPGSSSTDGRAGSSGGTVSSNGGGVISVVGLVWSNVSGFNPDTVVYNKATIAGSGSFTSMLNNLKPGTTYYVRAYVINSVGTAYASNEISFTTFDYPVVTTTPPISATITSVSAQAGGNITSNGGTSLIKSGICWGVDSLPTIANDQTNNGSGIGNFINTITNLMGSTTYYVRAYAVNSVGISYGSVESFTTKPPVLPTIQTTTPYATSSTTASGGGNITSNGGALVTTRGVVWSAVSGFNPDTVVYNKSAATGYYSGTFQASIARLQPQTIYYVRAYVENSVGIVYGQEMSFITPTLPTLTTDYASANGPTTGTIGATIHDEGGAQVYARGFLWSTNPAFNPDTVLVNKLSSGSGGGGFSSILKGLKGNTTYYVMAYATNIAGTSYGNMVSFITDPATLPSIVTRNASNISGTYAYSGGDISDDGGEPVTTRGIVWSSKQGFRADTVVVNKTSISGLGNGSFSSVATGLKMGTTYYARAYAVSSIGIVYGNEISFITLDLPKVSTDPAAAGSSGYNASGGGTLISDGGTTITNQGVCWSTNHNPTVGLYTHTSYDPWAGNSFYSSMTNLQPATTYYVKAYVTNSQGIAYGAEVSFTTPVALPAIATKVVSATSNSSVASGGTITNTGGGTITAKGVVWSTDPGFIPDTVVVNRTMDGSGSANFTSIISGLQLTTAYYIRSYATNSAGTSYGNQVSITIFPTAPMLTTVDPTAITGYSSTSGGIITSDGGAGITQKGICWATHTNPTIDDFKTNNGSGTDAFSAGLTGLLPNTLYYVRAYAINKIGVAYGAEKTILTNGIPVLSATFPATNVIATTATSGGEITDDGRSKILSRGICWSIYSNPTVALSTLTVDTTIHTIGSFFANMTGLTPNTTYYVRSYATNAVGVGYGSETTFNTLPVTVPSLTTTKPYATDSIAATSGGNIIDDGGMPVTVRGICWSKSPNPTTALATKMNNATGGTGSFTNVMAGLSPGTKYYVRAYAINSEGTAYGNLDSVTTMAAKPTVSNVSMSDIALSTAVGSATVIYDGGAPVTARGFCWNTTGNPTLADNLLPLGTGTGAIKDTIRGLNDTPTYYIRAYATNSSGTGYSPTVTSFKLCPATFSVIHVAGLNGAPVSKTVTYHSISTSIGGKGACWLTQNLGADRQATSIAETADDAAGWYWQFNRSLGYKHDGTTRTPSTPWITSISENSNWQPSNDPCALLLSNGWRMPTMTEWTNAVSSMAAQGQSPYASPLKLHYGGYLEAGNASLSSRGSWSQAWSSTAASAATASYVDFGNNGTLRMFSNNKWYGFSVRCIRDSLVISKPSVSNVALLNMTNTSVDVKATVSPDGGATVTARGFCWNTTGKPTITDNPIPMGNGVGTIATTLSGLQEGPTYYVRAYAINSQGVTYSSDSLGFKICPPTFTIQHVAGMNGSAESKTVVYHSINSTYSGAARCWITQNLGADSVASSIGDATAQSAGWYWQFNRVQGYAYATTRVPATTWTSISETSDWLPANDPCVRMLGGGWRIPTMTEWSNTIATIQAKSESPYTSPLKLHYNGYIEASNAALYSRGSWATQWSSNATSATTASYVDFGNNGTFRMFSNSKWYAFAVRCLRDTIVLTVPSVSDVATSNITASSIDIAATIAPDGGSPVTDRGFCWNTTGNPTLSDNVISSGTGMGSIAATLSSLSVNSTYYVRAFATNSKGTAYSPTVNSFKICPATFSVQHIQGLNGAPVDKTITYHSVSSNISGKPACWLTQDLGADSVPTSITDVSAQSLGWYWQFNRIQGYKHDGTTMTPSAAWLTSISENSDWISANDPCIRLLGTGWRIPTLTECTNVYNSMIANKETPYTSPLKLHYTGFIEASSASLSQRGSWSQVWSSTAASVTTASYIDFGNNGTVRMWSDTKRHGLTVRCLRDTIILSAPSISDVKTSNITSSSSDLTASVAPDGGAPVTARGFCWNTTGNPTLNDNVINSGTGLGSIATTLSSLSENYTYYVRAFATNSIGTAYSPTVTSFKVCPATFSVQHIQGLNGAPVSKTVTYHSVSSNMGGKPACWLTQNLGADQQATAVNDATEASAGWYWQFNRTQGFQYTTVCYPAVWAAINESSDWVPINDPCNLLLGGGWRIPTYVEWANAAGAPQNWANSTNAYNSILKLHAAGYLSNGSIDSRGVTGEFWTSTQASATNGGNLGFNTNVCYMQNNTKSTYGFSLRCIRDSIVLTAPSVSDVKTSNITSSSSDLTASVAPDGGAPVTARGFCWNTTGNPGLSDNVINTGTGLGAISTTLSSLSEDYTYYVRAFATNSKGTAYSSNVTSFKICPTSFSVIHTAGLNGAPVSKTVTYHSVSSNMGGKPACWLTQNLGADQQASSVDDTAEASAGWYWQFNRIQGYKIDGSSRVPGTSWNQVNENSNWIPANDPCNKLLGLGWRIPTLTEWTNADGAPQNWNTSVDAFNSILKIHRAGWINWNDGSAGTRGSGNAHYWTSTQYSSDNGYFYYINPTSSAITYSYKSHGLSVRCIRDTITLSIPSVSSVTIPTASMTANSAVGSATVATDGGSPITQRGICWNTTGNPTIADNNTVVSGTIGNLSGTLSGLVEGPVYYVRAFATNAKGTAYSPDVTSFRICAAAFSVAHTAGLNGAPVSKTVTYHSVYSTLSGAPMCWLTQNLGADLQANAADDATEASAGWYWQFNHLQGYMHDGTSRTPSNASAPWSTNLTENADWIAANDPCNKLLGVGWRMPTVTEWSNADGAPQNWQNATDAFNSVLKLHMSGWLEWNTGNLTGRGTQGNFWSSTQWGDIVRAHFLIINPTGSGTTYAEKSHGFSARCIRDSFTATKPTVSDVNTSNSTASTIDLAAAATDGGTPITARGFCWNTTGAIPTLSDNVSYNSSSGTGSFVNTLASVSEGPTYYVRAFATNAVGTTYSSNVTSFKICPASFPVTHTAGINGAPESKTVTYHSVNSNLSGAAMCWLTQNLGADQQASSIGDGADAAAGWYWQFNRLQGYAYSSGLIPAVSLGGVNESSDWTLANDPCDKLLGNGWRIPTATEWNTVRNSIIANGQSPYSSVLKLHFAGLIQSSNSTLVYRGSWGELWSSSEQGSNNATCFELNYYGNFYMYTYNKSHALSVRCIK